MREGTTIFPGNMAFGATQVAQMAYDVAYASGRELRALGINMNLDTGVNQAQACIDPNGRIVLQLTNQSTASDVLL